MWWRNRLAFLVIALALGACGFTPLHSRAPQAESEGATGVRLSHIGVTATVPDITQRRLMEQFKADLQDRLNPSGATLPASEYRLHALITTSEVGVGISRDGTVSRYNMYVNADLTLSRLSDGQVVFFSRARRVSSYNNVSSAFYSTYAAREDALTRAVSGLADDVRTRLANLFAGNPNPPPLQKPVQEEGPPPLPMGVRGPYEDYLPRPVPVTP